MKLTQKQSQLVTDNMGLVGKVIKDKVHSPNQLGIYAYDDIFQIGCIGLCKAAATDKGGCFSTYAYRLIWHEICNALIYASRRSAEELSTDPEVMEFPARYGEDVFEDSIELQNLLDTAESQTEGIIAKGIRALRMMADGYTSREIGEQMETSANNVTAWISKARKYLKSNPELTELKNATL